MIGKQARWRRLHRAEPLEQRGWPMLVRGLRDLLVRMPETLDGILLSRTDDPVTDLLRSLGTQSEDRKATQKAVKKLLDDGYLVWFEEDRSLRIRNFDPAQTDDEDTESVIPTPRERPAAMTPVVADLSEKRRIAGSKGGQVSAKLKQTVKQTVKQTGEQNSEQPEQTAKQNAQANQANGSSKPEQSASARDPEDQRKEEKKREDLPRNSGDPSQQDLGCAREGSVLLEANAQANAQANEAKPTSRPDAVAMAKVWVRNRQEAVMQFGPIENWPELRPITEAFRATWGRDDAIRNSWDPRAEVILNRLAEGYAVADLVQAIERSKFADYMVDKQSNQSLLTILRDGERVDRFKSLTAPVRKAQGAAVPKQPNSGLKPPVENR